MKSICAVPDCLYYPDEKSENLKPDVPVKEDQAGYRDDDEKSLNEKAGVIHDTPRLILFSILRV
jgi:hypothetical protein